SIGCGMWTQLALTQELEPKPASSAAARDPSIRSRPVKSAFQWQIATFVLATLLAVVFGIWRIYQPVAKPTNAAAASTVTTSPPAVIVVRLPPFSSGSSLAPYEPLLAAVCAARQALERSASTFAIVVG